MSNMSYCRFRNTENDLADCREALEALVNDPAARPVSGEELSAAKRLAGDCLAILQLLANYHTDGVLEDLDEGKIGEALDDMNSVAGRDRDEDEEGV